MADKKDAYEHDANRDPISGEPGAHPVGTGLGAAAGGAVAGAAAGAFAGPAGAVVGGVVGAVAGGLGGKAAAEAVNPTAEDAYWRDNYVKEPYYEKGRAYEEYQPAYELGWSSRTRYEGPFDAAEPRLSAEWDKGRTDSSLSWNQARPATLAAWERADRIQRDIREDDDVLDTLNDLLENARDGEYGFRSAAEHAKSSDIKTLLQRHAEECRAAAVELQTQLVALGGKPDEGGTAGGALHRGWIAVKSALSTYDDKAVLEEVERGEDTAVARYRKALKANLPANVRSLVERQAQGAQRNHDQVKALRDALRTK
jgi:uncharacterized protein (TIGR02284 family)